MFLRRVLLVAFLVASLALVTLYSREGQDGPLHAVQSGVSGAVAPLKFVGAAASAGVNDAAEGFGNLTADESTLSGLRESNAELRELLSQADEYKQEAQRLQKLLELKDLYEIDGVGARVIGNPDQAWSQAVTIDKGTADGVETGLTVMGTSGVVGQVYSAWSRAVRRASCAGRSKACCIWRTSMPTRWSILATWWSRRVWAAATRPASSSAPS